MKAKTRGETIVEILIAMTILVMIITSTYVILMRAMKTNTSIKNRVRALNIAREGIEGVRNIRDTNWLRYSGNRRNQWLCRPGLSQNAGANNPYGFDLNAIDSDAIYSQNVINGFSSTSYLRECVVNPITDGFYILEYFDPPNLSTFTPRYILEPQISPTSPLGSPDDNRERFQLHWVENRSTHASRYYNPIGAGGYVNTDPSIFYRIITIETAPVFEDPDNPGNCLPIAQDPAPDPGCSNLEKLKVTSVVQWDEEGDNKFESVTLETHLYDYFERTSY